MELNISSPGNRRPRPAEAAEESEAVRGAPDGRACARQGAQGLEHIGARRPPGGPQHGPGEAPAAAFHLRWSHHRRRL